MSNHSNPTSTTFYATLAGCSFKSTSFNYYDNQGWDLNKMVLNVQGVNTSTLTFKFTFNYNWNLEFTFGIDGIKCAHGVTYSHMNGLGTSYPTPGSY